MDEIKELFLTLDDEEFTRLLQNADTPEDKELSERIKARLELPSENSSPSKSVRLVRFLPFAAAFSVLVAAAIIFSVNRTQKPATTSLQPTAQTTLTTVAPPEENPLMVAISNGNDDLVAKLLTLPGLISREALEFALGFSDLLSYETISKIAHSVEELLGSTGLDALVEGALFGDSQKALEELEKRETMLMTPLEKLAFFFAVAFCDSDVVDAFVSRGYDIHTTDLQGNSIYSIAKKYGNEDTMKYAVSMGITE